MNYFFSLGILSHWIAWWHFFFLFWQSSRSLTWRKVILKNLTFLYSDVEIVISWSPFLYRSGACDVCDEKLNRKQSIITGWQPKRYNENISRFDLCSSEGVENRPFHCFYSIGRSRWRLPAHRSSLFCIAHINNISRWKLPSNMKFSIFYIDRRCNLFSYCIFRSFRMQMTTNWKWWNETVLNAWTIVHKHAMQTLWTSEQSNTCTYSINNNSNKMENCSTRTIFLWFNSHWISFGGSQKVW